MTLVLVETDRPGFKRGRNLKKIGQNAQDTAELFFEDVRVPPSNILGEEGRGFACLMNQLPRERLLVAIGAVAIMEAALQWTIDYTRERKAFGKSIADFQNTRFKLAEVKTEVTIARVFLNHCLELFLAGELDATTAAMSKWWLTELDNKVLDTCLQLFGGYGYMLEYPIARAYRRRPRASHLRRHHGDHEGAGGAVAVGVRPSGSMPFCGCEDGVSPRGLTPLRGTHALRRYRSTMPPPWPG